MHSGLAAFLDDPIDGRIASLRGQAPAMDVAKYAEALVDENLKFSYA